MKRIPCNCKNNIKLKKKITLISIFISSAIVLCYQQIFEMKIVTHTPSTSCNDI